MLADKILLETSVKLGQERCKILEEYISLHIQPKPRWLPCLIWHMVLRRVIVLHIERK